MATIAAVYFLGRREGQLDSTTLLLGGIISASFLSAIIMFLMTTLAGRDLRGMVFWLMGDLSTPVPAGLRWIFTVGLLAAIGAIYTTAADLNLLLTGEREAIHLGVDVTRVKLVVYVSASLLTALAVSASGAIGYVGLAGAARGAVAVRLGLPAADSGFGAGRRNCNCSGGHAGANGGRADGIAGRRDDGNGRRAAVYLFASAGNEDEHRTTSVASDVLGWRDLTWRTRIAPEWRFSRRQSRRLAFPGKPRNRNRTTLL